MGEPRHSQKYYDAVTPEGRPAHYNRKNWENRETFVNVTRKNVLRSNVLKNKGWINMSDWLGVELSKDWR